MGIILLIFTQAADFVIIAVGLFSGLYTLCVIEEGSSNLHNPHLGVFLQGVAACGLVTSSLLPPVVVLARHLGGVSCVVSCMVTEGLLTAVGATGGAGILLLPALEALSGTPSSRVGCVLRFLPFSACLVVVLHGLVCGVMEVHTFVLMAGQHDEQPTAANNTQEECVDNPYWKVMEDSQWAKLSTVDTLLVLCMSTFILVTVVSVSLVSMRIRTSSRRTNKEDSSGCDRRRPEEHECSSIESSSGIVTNGPASSVTFIANSGRMSSCSQDADIVVRLDKTDAMSKTPDRTQRKSDVSSVRISSMPFSPRTSQLLLPGTVNKPPPDHGNNIINVSATVRRRHQPRGSAPAFATPCATGRHQCDAPTHNDCHSISSGTSFFSVGRHPSTSSSYQPGLHSFSSSSTFSIGGPAAKYLTASAKKGIAEEEDVGREMASSGKGDGEVKAQGMPRNAVYPQGNSHEWNDNTRVIDRVGNSKKSPGPQEERSQTVLDNGSSFKVKSHTLSSFSNNLCPVQPGMIQKKLTWSSARQAISSVSDNVPVQISVNFPLAQKRRTPTRGWIAEEDQAKGYDEGEENTHGDPLTSHSKAYIANAERASPIRVGMQEAHGFDGIGEVGTAVSQRTDRDAHAGSGEAKAGRGATEGDRRPTGILNNVQREDEQLKEGHQGGGRLTKTSTQHFVKQPKYQRCRTASWGVTKEVNPASRAGGSGPAADGVEADMSSSIERGLLRAALFTVTCLSVLLVAAGGRLVWGPACHSPCSWFLNMADTAQRLALTLSPVLYLHLSEALQRCLEVISNP